MIASRSTARNSQDSAESTSKRSTVRANIPLQSMAIRITTEVDHETDLGRQMSDSKSDVHDDSQEQADIPKYPSALSFDDRMV